MSETTTTGGETSKWRNVHKSTELTFCIYCNSKKQNSRSFWFLNDLSILHDIKRIHNSRLVM